MKKLFLLATAFVGLSFHLGAQCVQCADVYQLLGTNASVLGTGCTSTGHSALASGYQSSASGNYSTALGYYALASGANATSMGKFVTASASNSFVIGSGYSSSYKLINNISNSIMLGMNSSTPSITIRQSSAQDTPAFVGIGTDDPKKEFHVNGNMMISGSNKALLFAELATSTYGDFGVRYSHGGLDFFLPNNGSPTNYLLYIKNNGNVGIGTNRPSCKFEVSGAAKTTALQTGSLDVTGNITFENLAGNTTQVVTVDTDGDLSSIALSTVQDNLGSHTASQNLNMNGYKIINNESNGGIYVDTNNNVGLGTLNPKQMLHVVGGNILISRVANRAPGSVNGSILFGDVTSTQYPYGAWGIEYINDNNYGHGLNFWKTHDANGNTINNVLFLSEDSNYRGNVGIGTTQPKHKLSVNGTIQAKELIVTTLSADWPDYVFETDYKLMSLKELGQYVTAEKHLPGVPSAEDMVDEGVKIGEMNAILLQKIEELTLYVIELQKQINELHIDKQ